MRSSGTSTNFISIRLRAAETGGPRQHVSPPRGALWPACGGAAPRCSGRRARCSSCVGGVPGKDLTRGEERRQNGIPELPDGRLACKPSDSCSPLIYLQQEETRTARGRERESRSPGHGGAPPPLRSSAQPVCTEHRDLRCAASACAH